MRWAEIGLLLAPFVLYVAWRVAAARAQPVVAWGALGVVAVLIAAVLAIGLSHRLDTGETYVPAHLDDGAVVPGHGVRLSKP